MRLHIRHALGAVLVGMSLCLVPVAADSQPYPTRPIRFIVPFPPGGDTDVIGRVVARKLSESLGQPVVVDNRSGAGGTIGTDFVAKAAPDGHTILLSAMGLAVNGALYRQLPYDALSDLAPISMVGNQPTILVVHPSVRANTLAEFLVLVRSNPGQVSYASGGFGSATYLAAELLNSMTNIKMVHVPYKGAGPAMTGLMSGDVQVFISPWGTVLPHVKAARLRPLAVTTLKRSPLFPNVPTVDEAGVPGYEFTSWYGLLVPAGTPSPIIEKLNREVEKTVTASDVREQFAGLNLESTPSSPEQFGAFIRSEMEKWTKVMRASGAKLE